MPPATFTPQPSRTSTPSPIPPTATPTPYPREAFGAITEDGVQIAGALFGEGPTVVVLAHVLTGDQTDWEPFAATLAETGYSAATFDFRGHGLSQGAPEVAKFDLDVRAVLALLRQLGYARFVCIGGSLGGTACGKAAHEPGLAGLAGLSMPVFDLRAADLAGTPYPKLFIVSAEDMLDGTDYLADAQQLFAWSPEPKRLEVLPGSTHGTDLFESEHAARVAALLLEFLASVESQE